LVNTGNSTRNIKKEKMSDREKEYDEETSYLEAQARERANEIKEALDRREDQQELLYSYIGKEMFQKLVEIDNNKNNLLDSIYGAMEEYE
tara:strand:+ start:1751 stop:2020 length:270 start_codon:yes stop_codon:yes gene_type:complete